MREGDRDAEQRSEEKEVAAANSMTTGWYVAQQGRLIFDASRKETTGTANRTILEGLSLNHDCQWRNPRLQPRRSTECRSPLLLLPVASFASTTITYFRTENFNSRNRQWLARSAASFFSPPPSLPECNLFRARFSRCTEKVYPEASKRYAPLRQCSILAFYEIDSYNKRFDIVSSL